MQDLPQIAGYRVEALIGRGGMGVVYRAEHLHLRRIVALKVLPPEVADTEGFRDRFVHEARIAAGIDHPSIVTVYDAGETDGLLYLAMRYVEGSDLSKLLREEGRLEPSRALGLLAQVAGALDAAHAHGLVHRDVKPANVLLQGERAYLTDFGLTKRTAAATAFTATGQFVGTIDYVAPEQVRGGEVSARTDVYALGCVLYECLVGGRPFPRDSEVAVLYAHLEEPPPRPSLHGLPTRLDDVIVRALAKDPAQRQSSCGDLIGEARDALSEPETAVAPPRAAVLPPADPPEPPAPRETAPARPTAPAGPTAGAGPTVPAGPTGAPEEPLSAPTLALPRRGSRRPAAMAGAGAALAAAAVVAVILATGGTEDRAAGPDGGAGGEAAEEREGGRREPEPREPAAAEVVERAAVGTEPVGVAVREGSAWITNSGDDTVSQLDAQTGEVRREAIPVGDAPHGVTVGRGSVWVVNSGDGTVSRLAAESGETVGTIPVGSDPRWAALGVGDGSLWVSNSGDGTVSRVDLATDRTVDVIEVGSEPRGIATTRTSVWVANSGDDTLTRIDVASGRTDDPVEVGSAPESIAIKDGVLWVANTGDDSVMRLDNRSGESLGPPIEVGDGPFGVWVGEEHVWVTSARDGSVTLIDPKSGKVAGRPVRVGSSPAGVRADEDGAWVAVTDDGRAVRLQPR